MIGGIYRMHTKKINIKNQVHYENLVKPKKQKLNKFFIGKEGYKDLMICFPRYHPDKSVIMLNLYYDIVIGFIEEYEGKKIT